MELFHSTYIWVLGASCRRLRRLRPPDGATHLLAFSKCLCRADDDIPNGVFFSPLEPVGSIRYKYIYIYEYGNMVYNNVIVRISLEDLLLFNKIYIYMYIYIHTNICICICIYIYPLSKSGWEDELFPWMDMLHYIYP